MGSIFSNCIKDNRVEQLTKDVHTLEQVLTNLVAENNNLSSSLDSMEEALDKETSDLNLRIKDLESKLNGIALALSNSLSDSQFRSASE